jgi:hypothetical protein
LTQRSRSPNGLLDAREEHVPAAMLLRRISSRATKSTVKHPQLKNVRDGEFLPAARRMAAALSADLIREQMFRAVTDAIVVRLGDPGPSRLVDKFDQMLPTDRAHKIMIHTCDATRPPHNVRRGSSALERSGWCRRTELEAGSLGQKPKDQADSTKIGAVKNKKVSFPRNSPFMDSNFGRGERI